MATVARTYEGRSRLRLPEGWPLYLVFLGFPVWWLLGMGAFIWPLAAVPMMLWLLFRSRVAAPPGFGIWALFLLWMLGSGTQLDEPQRFIAFGYRVSIYLAATVILLYVYNLPRRSAPTERIIGVMAGFWVVTVVGGLLGLALPDVSFPSLVQTVLPASLAGNSFVRDLVRPEFAQIHIFLGYPLPRPKAPFVYTNDWGAMYALLTPFLIASWGLVRSRWWKPVTGLLLVASLVPVAVSVNRGLWISLGIGLLYAAFRQSLRGRFKPLGGILVLVTIAGMLVLFTPLRGIIDDRLQTPHSNERRLSLYQQAAEGALESPLLGFGSPRPADNPNAPSVGTQGQFWLVLFSHGFVGVALYVLFFLRMLWRSRSIRSPALSWCHLVVFIAVLQLPFYGHLPAQLCVVMIAIALMEREMAGAPPADGAGEPARVALEG